MPPRPPEAISYDEIRPDEIVRLTRERFSYVTQWIYGIALFSALLTAGVIVSIYLSVYVLNRQPVIISTTTVETTTTDTAPPTTTPPVTQPPLTCSEVGACPLNCTSVAGCLPPPSAIVCNDVHGCIDGGNLTLSTLNLQDALVCDINASSPLVGDTCLPLRIKSINTILPNAMTKNFVVAGGPGIGIAATPNGLDIFNAGVLHVGLSAPVDEFNVTVDVVTTMGTLTFVKKAQLPRTVWAGPASNVSGAQIPVFRALVEEDIPLLSLLNKVYGVLSVALGGTGTNATLVGGRVMISSASQAIVEGPALTGLGEFLIGDGAGGVIPAQLVGGYDLNVTVYPNGTIVLSALQGVHSVDLAVPTDLFVVTSPVITDTGTLSFAVLPQSGNSFWASPANGTTGVPVFRQIVEADVPLLSLLTKVYGTLSVALGGTNNTGPLSGNRLMMSEAGGLSIVETPALLNGQVFIGQNGGGPPVAATPTGAGGITVGTGPGTMSITMTSTPSFNTLNVNGATTLGTSTTCASPLANQCVDISTKTCPGGPVGVNCIPTTGLHLAELTVDVLNIVNFTTQTTVQVINGTTMATDNLYVENIYVVNNGSITCSGSGMVAPNCVDISNKECPLGPLASSCTPINLTASNIQSTGTAIFNNVVCLGGAIPDNCVAIDDKTCTSPVNDTCVSLHVKTVNGVAPNAFTRDLTLSAGTGIGVAGTTITNTVASTPQVANLFYASPDGTSGVPGFRGILVADLPALGPDEIIFGAMGATNLTQLVAARAVTSVDATVPSGLLAVSGVPFGPGAGTIALSLQSQGPNTVFASPVNATGTPGFRNLTYSDLPPVITFVDLTVPLDILAVSNNPLTGSGGTLAVSKVDQSDNTLFASPADGSLGQPTFRKQVFKDFRNLNLTDGQLLGGTTGGDAVPTDIVAGSGVVINKVAGAITISASVNASNIGTVTNVCIMAPGTLFTFSPPCINTSGTFAFVPLVQQANKFFGAPVGSNGFPGMRYLEIPDLPRLHANQIYLGDPVSSNTSITNLTAGNAISIVTSGELTTISSTFSVGLDLPTSVFNVTVPLVTDTGTLTAVFKTQAAKKFFAGPLAGSPDAIPAFRDIALADLPALGDGQLYIGNMGVPIVTTISAGPGVAVTTGMGSLTISATNFGTVTSVALALPVSVFSVGGAVTSSGTLTGTFISQAANTFFASPNGATGVPTFRAMVAADVPNLDTSKLTTGVLPIARGGTNSGTALTNNRIMVSSGGAIVVAAALSTGQVLAGVTSGAPAATTIAGTANQVIVTNGVGTMTFSTPQNIHTAATPTFASETLSATTNQLRLGTTNTVTISSTAPSASRTYTLHDAGANANFVLSTGSALTITNAPSVGTVLTGTGATTASFQAPAAATAVTHFEVSSTTSVPGFSTGTFTVATDMSTILSAGSWHVTFSTIIVPTSSSGTYEVGIFNGVSIVAHSSRSVSGSSAAYTVHTQAVVVSDGSTAISVQWRKFSGSGSGTMFSRSMFALRVA